MKRRQWLRWGCAQCVACSGVALAQTGGPSGSASAADLPAWAAPQRFTRPDLASDEGGLWALMDREESRLRRSAFRMRDEALLAYLSGIACKLGGSHCPDIRVYPLRMPYFNASMAPNGMMQIWSGLLLRVDNEAQLAAVIGHEIGHYLMRHTLERLRDIKARAAFGQFMGLFGIVGLMGQLATLASAMAFSRDQERDADRIGLQLMRQTDYDPREAAKVWANLQQELRANPAGDPGVGSVMLATHPPSDERRITLETLAADAGGQTFEAEYRARLAPFRPQLLEDEVKRGRPDESLALLTRLLTVEPGQPELLHFRAEAYRQRGKPEDTEPALADVQAALQTGRAPTDSLRLLGQLQHRAGRQDAARDAWRQYLDRAPQAPDADMIRQQLQETTP